MYFLPDQLERQDQQLHEQLDQQEHPVTVGRAGNREKS
jgi:hypothetical protein